MKIAVCVKRVPDLAEAELDLGERRLSWDEFAEELEDEVEFRTNEWDDVAVEAAVRLAERFDATVTAVTVGGEDADEVLRRALAMGATGAVHVRDDALDGRDPWQTARALAAVLAPAHYDLVLVGAIAADGANGAVGGLLAGLLGLPSVALATGLEVEDGKVRVRHEVEGGLEREVELDLPALVTVQTGLVEPRYVSIRGIRRVADAEIPTRDAASLGLAGEALSPRTEVLEVFAPPAGEGGEKLQGSPEETARELVARLRERGVL